ncbi:MAG: hypothetical protein ACKOCN_05985 [Planctomycetaceae bacterium]
MVRIARSGCGNLLDETAVAAFRGGESPMGDDWSNTCYRCPGCGQYTVEHWTEKFMADDVVDVRGPLSPEEGEAIVRQMEERSASEDE